MQDANTDRQFTLLLVDDNPTNLLLLTKIIELDLHEVRILTAGSAHEGLEIAARQKIDGAFIDVQMPGMTGLDMCRRLNESPSTAGLPLVLMTAHLASPEMRAEGLEVGAYDFISQPISNVEMLARVKVMLRLCAQERRSVQLNQGLRQQIDDQSLRLRWISGLLISGEGAVTMPDQQLIKHLVSVLPDPTTTEDQVFFDRLTSEFPLPWRRTLLKLSLLTGTPVSLARELSEINDIEAVFDYLYRHELALKQSFEGQDVVLFKPRTRDLLRQKAQHELEALEIQKIYAQAADWYTQRNDHASALECLVEAQQYPLVSQLLSQYGYDLFDDDQAARVQMLISAIPEDLVAQCGWMSLFKGVSCLNAQSGEVDSWLELAFQLFCSGKDERGQLLALTQQVFLSLYQDGCFERWSKRLERLRELALSQRSLLNEVEQFKVAYALGCAELFFAGRLKEVEKILESSLAEAQQRQLARPQMELNLLRSLLGLQQGRYLVAKTALEQAFKFSYQISQVIEHRVLQVAACEILHAEGDLEGFRQQLKIFKQCCHEAFEQSLFSPLLSYYEATLLLARGEYQGALERLELARFDGSSVTHSHMKSRLLQLCAFCRAATGQSAAAFDDINLAMQLRKKAGGVFPRQENLLFAGMTFALLKDYEQSAGYLEAGLQQSRTTQEERLRPGFHAWSVVVENALGRADVAEEHLGELIRQLKRHKVTYAWGLTPELLQDLSGRAWDTQTQLVLRQLFEKYSLLTFNAQNDLIPVLRIRTMGGFELALDDIRFDFSHVGFGSRQIFALLVIAPNHAMSLELVMSLLWPESPASRARSSFDTAHSRLRRALEECYGPRIRQDYLVLEKGMLALKNIQVDCNVVESTMAQAHYYLQRGSDWQAELLLWKIDALCNGEFLAGFDLVEDLLNRREQLNRQHLEQLELLAQLLKKRQQYAEAIRLLQRGLELDPTQDALIRQLLSLYRVQQDHRAAGALLEKYRVALKKEDYDQYEIDELVDALGVQWLTRH